MGRTGGRAVVFPSPSRLDLYPESMPSRPGHRRCAQSRTIERRACPGPSLARIRKDQAPENDAALRPHAFAMKLGGPAERRTSGPVTVDVLVRFDPSCRSAADIFPEPLLGASIRDYAVVLAPDGRACPNETGPGPDRYSAPPLSPLIRIPTPTRSLAMRPPRHGDGHEYAGGLSGRGLQTGEMRAVPAFPRHRRARSEGRASGPRA